MVYARRIGDFLLKTFEVTAGLSRVLTINYTRNDMFSFLLFTDDDFCIKLNFLNHQSE